MFTLGIEHAISDFATWKRAFNRFAEVRQKAGVVSHRIRRPVDDPHYLVIELEFVAQRPRTISATSYTASCGLTATRPWRSLAPQPAGSEETPRAGQRSWPERHPPRSLVSRSSASGCWKASKRSAGGCPTADYLTFLATTLLLRLEIYEIIHKGTALEVIGVVINVALVVVFTQMSHFAQMHVDRRCFIYCRQASVRPA